MLPLDRRLTEAERFPLLTPAGRQLLHHLQEHPHAPRYNHQCGDRLTAAGLQHVQEYAAAIAQTPKWGPDTYPAWLVNFVAYCLRQVPHYRHYGLWSRPFTELPTCDRSDLSRAPWAFVPDDQPLQELIVYATSGTTGHPITILSHPEASAKYIPLLRAALATHDLTLKGGPGQVALILACFQKSTYTYPAIAGALDNGGFIKLNLNPADWRDPADRAQFIDDCTPEVFTGDPIAFAELANLPLTTCPKALISTSMQLLPGLQHQLSARFGCPILDLYAMNETGPIAVALPPAPNLPASTTHYHLLQPHLYIEILDPHGTPCPPGVRGEITVTGGFNPFLPLLRYRTNDYAALTFVNQQPCLVDVAGRPPVVFRTPTGQYINNIDVTQALRPLALPQFTLHQAAAGALHLRVRRCSAAPATIQAALQNLFGPDQPLTVVEVDTLGDKVIQYTQD